MNIAVLAGGLSPERDVSLASGALIANALIRNGHSIALLDVFMDVKSDGILSPKELFQNTPYDVYRVSEDAPSLLLIKEIRTHSRGSKCGENALVGRGVIEVCEAADVTFIALHGAMGENGQLQALLDCHGISYTGSCYSGCLVAMDKDISKKIMVYDKIDTAEWVTVCTENPDIEKIIENIGFPCVVKPKTCGSSVGVSIVSHAKELSAAIDAASVYEKTLIVERWVGGREFSVGVLNGKALPSIEIIPKYGFYDYRNKYQGGLTEEITPADIPIELEERLENEAVKVHNAMNLGCYSRSDFIYDSQTDRLICLEVNTLPGMTPTSLLPQEAAAAGICYDELCEIIVTHPVGLGVVTGE